MNPFVWIYTNLVHNTQINILQFFFNISGDIGVAIVLLAITVNLLLWPLLASTYINGQKTRILQPEMQKIRDQYKDNPQEMIKATQAFNKKHNINNSAFLLVIVCQIFFAIGLLNITQSVSHGSVIDGLYPWLFGKTEASFGANPVAFGFIQINESPWKYIWIAILNAVLSFAYGWYTFKIAPRPMMRELQERKKNEPKKEGAIDTQGFQKMIELQTIYFFPALIFFTNLSFNTGVNIYFLTVSVLALVRQVFLTNYFASHEDKLLESIIASDPAVNKDAEAAETENAIDVAITTESELESSSNTITIKPKKASTKAKVKEVSKKKVKKSSKKK